MKTSGAYVILVLIWINAVLCVPVLRSPVGLAASPDTASADDHIAGKDEPTLERNPRKLLPTDQGNVDLGVVVTDEENKERYVREAAQGGIDPAFTVLLGMAGCDILKPQYLEGNCEMAGDQFTSRGGAVCDAAIKDFNKACADLLAASGAKELKRVVQSGF